ncbi:uncharacterized protein LOC117903243 [Drosophila subobscura]|uniref:uncharacterized protein LOC117903243 n=1 Tax=Drosophila subobscura TaxID=7241 RepID=UPI00155A99C7|nr:uncharacterized protein LOC117903243 [Drosophila subobscura]
MPYKRRAATPNGSQEALDGVPRARRHHIYGKNRLFPLNKRSKAEQHGLATIRQQLNTDFQDEVEATALSMVAVENRLDNSEPQLRIESPPAHWMQKYRKYFLILVLLLLLPIAIVFGYTFYLRFFYEDTPEKRFENKMESADMPLKLLFRVLRWVAGKEIF